VQGLGGKAQKKRDHSEERSVDGRMGLEWIVGRLAGGVGVEWIDFTGDRDR
jgi:hypothetical protein